MSPTTGLPPGDGRARGFADRTVIADECPPPSGAANLPRSGNNQGMSADMLLWWRPPGVGADARRRRGRGRSSRRWLVVCLIGLTLVFAAVLVLSVVFFGGNEGSPDYGEDGAGAIVVEQVPARF